MAQYEELTIDQGSDVTIELHLVDKNATAKNLTGHSLAAKLKRIITVVILIRQLSLQLLAMSLEE